MKKKVLLVLAIFLVGIFMPKIVFAEGDVLFPESLIVGVGEEEYDLLAGDEIDGISYDADTYTLELNNFEGKYIKSTNVRLDIVLKGENILSDYDNTNLDLSGAIYSISGDGSLDIETDEDENTAVYIVGNLTIDGGTLNISGADEGMRIKGDLTINDGTLNISNCHVAIELSLNTIDGNGNFTANGGKVNISSCKYGIDLRGSFILNGADVVIKNGYVGVISAEGFCLGSLEINKGSISFKDIEEGGVGLIMFFDPADTDIDKVLKFNRDDLYIDNPEYDFRMFEYTNDGDSAIYLTIGLEGIEASDMEDEEGIAKFARNYSILPKKSYKVTEGDKQKIESKAGIIKIDADLDKFVALYINDELVDGANYELESGSTIIKLKEDYTKKLSAGNYKFKVVFTDGVAEGEFTVTTENPETSDGIICTIVLLVVALSSLVTIKKYLEA